MKLICTNRQARVIGTPLITNGSVGMRIDFEFSPSWKGLTKVVCFRGSGESIDVLLTDDHCIIPHECMSKDGGILEIGVYGYVIEDGETKIVMPTVWASAGEIKIGVAPSEKETAPITPDLAEQVIAIAESVRTDADSGKFNGKDGYTPIKGVDYFDGRDGRDGIDGRDGYTPIKGVDYFDGKDGKDGADGKDYVLTDADKTEIAAEAAGLVDMPVTDVTINGASIVDGGVAAVPTAGEQQRGLLSYYPAYKYGVLDGAIFAKKITASEYPTVSDYAFIGKGSLNNVLATPSIMPALTDSEKAAARARMGVDDDWFTIADVTLTEDVSSINFQNTIPLKKIHVVINADFSASFATTFSPYLVNQNGRYLFGMGIGGTGNRRVIMDIEVLDDCLFCEGYSNANGSVHYGAQLYKAANNGSNIITKLPITQLALNAEWNKSGIFPAGMRFVIEGVAK